MGFTRNDLKDMPVSEARTWLDANRHRRKAKEKALRNRLRKAKGKAFPVVDLGRMD